MKNIAQHGIKVILSGQGADDYLSGYMHSYYRFYADCIRLLHIGTFFNEAYRHTQYQNLNFSTGKNIVAKTLASLLFSESELSKLEFKYGGFFAFGKTPSEFELKLNSKNKLNSMHEAMILYTSLPGLLHFEDRNSMAFSIESRVPFLDHRMIEYAFSITYDYKIRNGYTKWILRESMNQILPDSIKNRKDKVGFVTPGEFKWLREDMSELLNLEYNVIPDLDVKKVKVMIDRFKKGDNQYAKIIWRIANMQYWIKNFV